MGKKGFGIVTNPGYAEKLRALKVSWFYSWGADLKPDMPEGIEFVPMLWGWRDGPGQDKYLHGLAESGAAGKFHTLLGFNEPDNKTQSNIAVETALEKWPQLAGVGLRLGSPACVHPDNEWMQAFMQGAEERNLRVDFIAVHWYGDAPDASGFLKMLERIHEKYQRPLWITEFAPADWKAGKGRPNRYTAAQAARFMRTVLPELNKRDYVERYAWFSGSPKDAALGISALFNEDGSLTELGRIYAGF